MAGTLRGTVPVAHEDEQERVTNAAGLHGLCADEIYVAKMEFHAVLENIAIFPVDIIV